MANLFTRHHLCKEVDSKRRFPARGFWKFF
jgi:hypothetical protein